MPSKTRLLEIADYLIRKVGTLHDMAIFLHGSENILDKEGVSFMLLAHEAGNCLIELRDRLALVSRCVEDTARRMPG
jgi:hypothetical protein